LGEVDKDQHVLEVERAGGGTGARSPRESVSLRKRSGPIVGKNKKKLQRWTSKSETEPQKFKKKPFQKGPWDELDKASWSTKRWMKLGKTGDSKKS